MLVRLEINPAKKCHQLRVWAKVFQHLDRQKLLDLATNPKQNVKNINVRADALFALEELLNNISKKTNNQNLLTDNEVAQLYKFIKDDDDFPVLVDPYELNVEDITHIKEHEDMPTKKIVKKDIEENVAVLKAQAALLIVDFGSQTNKLMQLHQSLVKTLTAILGNMLREPDHLFIKEKKTGEDTVQAVASNYFKAFVEALYFIDNAAAKPFMDFFNITLNDFSYDRKLKKAS